MDCQRKKLLGQPWQTKLKLSEPGDIYEREADRIADQVLAAPLYSNVNGARTHIQRFAGQPKGSTDVVPATVDRVLSSPGKPLEPALKQDMEQRFGYDFSRVKVHSGTTAEQSAQDVSAKAYTVGDNIVFGANEFAPATHEGRRLIAHELTHVVQQSNLDERACVGKHNKNAVSTVHANVSAVAAIHRQPADKADVGKDEVNKALNEWELAENRAINRYRNWLTHNMILFLSDVLQSGKGGAAIEKIKGGFAQNFAEQSLGNLGSLAGVEIGARVGGRQLAKLFLSLRTAKIFGGAVGFVVGAIIEALIGDLLDKTNEIIKATAEQMDKLVTGLVNPIVNSKQEEITSAIQGLRDDILITSMSSQEWRHISNEIDTATDQIGQIFQDEGEESLYRQLALVSDVFSGKSVQAEEKSPVTLGNDQHDFQFRMEHTVVKTGQTSIIVTRDKGTVVVRSHGYDCLKDDDGSFFPVDIQGPDASPAWKVVPPPREYHIQLYQSGIISDSDIGVPRTFRVGKDEYGVWYNLAKGTYHLEAMRGDDHIVGLCAEGSYWVQGATTNKPD
jgi:Domain of unknown function (DUF4157)